MFVKTDCLKYRSRRVCRNVLQVRGGESHGKRAKRFQDMICRCVLESFKALKPKRHRSFLIETPWGVRYTSRLASFCLSAMYKGFTSTVILYHNDFGNRNCRASRKSTKTHVNTGEKKTITLTDTFTADNTLTQGWLTSQSLFWHFFFCYAFSIYSWMLASFSSTFIKWYSCELLR